MHTDKQTTMGFFKNVQNYLQIINQYANDVTLQCNSMQNCLAKRRNVAIFANDIFTSCKNQKDSHVQRSNKCKAIKCNFQLAWFKNILLFSNSTITQYIKTQKAHSLLKHAFSIVVSVICKVGSFFRLFVGMFVRILSILQPLKIWKIA